MTSRILVVGAGIGGLSAAIALAQIGAKVDVIEIKEDNSVPGVGFGLRLNGLRAVREIGLLEQCLAIGNRADATATKLLTIESNTTEMLRDRANGSSFDILTPLVRY